MTDGYVIGPRCTQIRTQVTTNPQIVKNLPVNTHTKKSKNAVLC